MLKVESINLHWSVNSKAHRTNKFEICSDCNDPTPVLRRGQAFKLSVNFDRPFKEVTDIVRVYFKCVDVEERSPRNVANLANITVTRGNAISQDNHTWSLALLSADGNSIHLKMKSPSTLPFATYKLHIDTKTKTNPGVKKYEHHKNVYFLFNPWEKGDEVYMVDTNLLDEYILNDVGKIFMSSEKQPKGEPWVFAQFAEPVLPALMLALKNSKLNFKKRGNPVHLAKALTGVLCSSEDYPNGVLKSKSNEKYQHTDCTDPVLWSNSAAIFEDYLKSDRKPVEFGQCWVFSAITTTACRAIGIPCRSVTNFCSAQDCDMTMSVEKYVIPADVDDDIEDVTDEQIWDFHVWNDVWMSRYDLPQGFGGWQVIDSSPVTGDMHSNFEHTCGPASLAAIKKGKIGENYNTNYFTSAVNADVINLVYDQEEAGWNSFKVTSIDLDKVGKIILTKLPFVYDPNGDSDFEDITNQYKEKEGTKEERLAFFYALSKTDFKSEAYNVDSTSFVEFKLKDIEHLDIGEDIVVHLEMKNEAVGEKVILISLAASSLFYNGIKGKLIKKFIEKVTIPSGQANVVKLRITADEYAPKLVELAFVKVYAVARVLEDNYIWAGEDHFVINLPEVVIGTKDPLKMKKEGKLYFTMRNPLKRKLTGCKFIYEALGIGRNVPVPCRDIMPEDELCVEHSVIPDKSGNLCITVMFDSKQLKCVKGRSTINVS